MNPSRSSLGPEHFQRLYDASSDPWQFRSSQYEQAKYRATIASLGTRRFRSGFEAGCSIGVLTRLLAERCERAAGSGYRRGPPCGGTRGLRRPATGALPADAGPAAMAE